MTYIPEHQYRCTIIRGKSQNDMEDMLPLYADIVHRNCPCTKNEFVERARKRLSKALFETEAFATLSESNLKTVDNGLDDLAVRRIINVPKRGIGQTTVDRLQSYADSQGCSFLKAIEQCKDIAGINGGTQKKLESFLNQIYLFRAKAEYQDVAELIETVLETTGYLEELATLEEEKAKQKQENK